MFPKNLIRRTAALSLALILALSLTIPAAAAGWFDPPATAAAGAILLDPDTGTVYFEKNPDKARPIASMTKLMSMYLVFDAIDDGRLALDQTIPVSDWAVYVSNNPSYSGHEKLKKDQEYLVEDLIKLVMTASCNGSMIALGEYLGGDETGFVQMMNDKAAEWGIPARFADCTGFKDTGNAVTPRAMAEIARRLLTDHPQILNYSTLKSTEFEGKTYNSTNTILRTDAMEGIDGLKTGYTGGAKYCFTGTARRDNVRMISVIMGTTSTARRMSESQAMLEYGFLRKDQLDRLAQADREFRSTITADRSPLIPYAETKLSAAVSGYDAALSVPCEVTWLAGGQAITAEPERVWVENGAVSSIGFRPQAGHTAEVTVQVRFPDGTTKDFSQSLPVSQEPLTLSSKLESSGAVIQKNGTLTATVSVTSDQGYDLAFAAGWYLDGQPVKGGERAEFLTSAGTDTLTLKGSDLSLGQHTLEFRCNPGGLPQLEQETASCVFSVRDACSPWAEEIIEGAVNAGLVPKSNQQNFSKAISRRNAAQMFVSLLEASSGTDIQTLLRLHNVTMDMNAFTDTKDTAVLACNALGILKGTAPGVFSPDSTLTRAQAAAILNRAARILGVETSGYTHSFTDVAGHWVNPELGWPAHAEILKGTGGGMFSPEIELTNEQAIAIVWRAWHVLGAA